MELDRELQLRSWVIASLVTWGVIFVTHPRTRSNDVAKLCGPRSAMLAQCCLVMLVQCCSAMLAQCCPPMIAQYSPATLAQYCPTMLAQWCSGMSTQCCPTFLPSYVGRKPSGAPYVGRGPVMCRPMPVDQMTSANEIRICWTFLHISASTLLQTILPGDHECTSFKPP